MEISADRLELSIGVFDLEKAIAQNPGYHDEMFEDEGLDVAPVTGA
jgi:hypothetical protein